MPTDPEDRERLAREVAEEPACGHCHRNSWIMLRAYQRNDGERGRGELICLTCLKTLLR